MIDIRQIEKTEILIDLIEIINLREETIKDGIKIESLIEMTGETNLKEIGKDNIEKREERDKEIIKMVIDNLEEMISIEMIGMIERIITEIEMIEEIDMIETKEMKEVMEVKETIDIKRDNLIMKEITNSRQESKENKVDIKIDNKKDMNQEMIDSIMKRDLKEIDMKKELLKDPLTICIKMLTSLIIDLRLQEIKNQRVISIEDQFQTKTN